MRAQTATEFIAFLALIVGIIVLILIPAINSMQVTLAISQVRLACSEYTQNNQLIECNSIDYAVSGSTVNIYPKIYSGTSRVFSQDALKTLMLLKLSQVFSPNQPRPSPNCVNSNVYSYCVDLAVA